MKMLIKRPIAISLSPNVEIDDVLLALKMLFSPIKWFDIGETKKLEEEFVGHFGKGYKAITVDSGRSAEYLILKALGVGDGDEVAIQALTCVVVPNPVLWLGARPVYIDVDDSFNMDPKDLGVKLSEKTRAIITQHSFGVPAQIEKIKNVAKKKKITLIEDCAVSLGAKYKGKKVGTFGDVAFFSFGRDKVISSVFGGMILCKDEELYEKLLDERENLDHVSPLWLVQQLLHPIAFSFILPLYCVGVGKITLGKILLFVLQKFKLLSKAISSDEKQNLFRAPKKLPGGVAVLVRNQLQKLDRFNKRRFEIASIYHKKLEDLKFKLPKVNKSAIWLRFTVLAASAKDLLEFAKSKNILLGDWYKDVVTSTESMAKVKYQRGSCPKAEEYAGDMINLPTYPTITNEQVGEVIGLLKSWKKLK